MQTIHLELRGGEPSSGTHSFQTVSSQNWIVENETTAFSSDGMARPAGNCQMLAGDASSPKTARSDNDPSVLRSSAPYIGAHKVVISFVEVVEHPRNTSSRAPRRRESVETEQSLLPPPLCRE